ncbi:DUF4097 family beta strand repeat-containing protein [Ruminococcus sp.]|uniref:DUF4097 family beta strand repeat-containing protein n=1 Tax=Ruminococcus sp. TaxID=41978 RepID=UPI0025D4703F|nr:DUF4097 family beta strand repeat-containing protein [Ruminococcus sp.]MCR4638292.1 DUF4097 family beta strand repeat-containing protein [Ruminococcus sp.]
MYENNNGITQEIQTAPQKKSSGNWVWITFLILGVVLLVTGIILFNNTDFKRHGKIKDFSESFSAADVERVNLEIGWADLTVSKSNDDKIYVEAKNVPEGFTADVKGDTFSTDFDNEKIHIGMLPAWLKNDDNETVVDIKLPDKEYASFVLDLGAGETSAAGFSCGKFRIECGAGEVTFEDIECETGSFDCGAGEVNIKGIKCDEKLYINGGAGEVNISSAVLGGIEADQGVGELNFTGTVNGDIDIDGGVGEIIVNLTNPESDFVGSGSKYKLDIDTGVGSKTVNYNVSR